MKPIMGILLLLLPLILFEEHKDPEETIGVCDERIPRQRKLWLRTMWQLHRWLCVCSPRLHWFSMQKHPILMYFMFELYKSQWIFFSYMNFLGCTLNPFKLYHLQNLTARSSTAHICIMWGSGCFHLFWISHLLF